MLPQINRKLSFEDEAQSCLWFFSKSSGCNAYFYQRQPRISPIAKLSNGANIQLRTIIKNGLSETNFCLYDKPAPKIAEETAWVLDNGILRTVAASTRKVEDSKVAVALEYRIRNSSSEIRLICPELKKNVPTKIATIAKIRCNATTSIA